MKGDILTLKLSYKTELLICHHLQSKQIRSKNFHGYFIQSDAYFVQISIINAWFSQIIVLFLQQNYKLKYFKYGKSE